MESVWEINANFVMVSIFCGMCTERSPSIGRICNDCKISRKLDCFICEKLCEYQCVSCKKST